ncbi:MAG: acyl carrier protein [Anaerolineae bacterium]|nr:acyl carrier protein [Anaerolineae bacterium]
MNPDEIQAIIKQILTDALQVDPCLISDATAETPLLGRGIGLDSVEAMRLGLGLENAFAISIPDAELTTELFSSLGTLTAYVQHKTVVAGKTVT